MGGALAPIPRHRESQGKTRHDTSQSTERVESIPRVEVLKALKGTILLAENFVRPPHEGG